MMDIGKDLQAAYDAGYKTGKTEVVMNQDYIAASLLSVFRDVWCKKNNTKRIEFNCERCEFEEGRHCLAKIFINNKIKKTESPQGFIAEPYKAGDSE